jgi:hypothetical protein
MREVEFDAEFRAQYSEFRNGCMISISHKSLIFMPSCDECVFFQQLNAIDCKLGFGSSSRHLLLDSVLLPLPRHSTRIRSLARPLILHSASFSIMDILHVTNLVFGSFHLVAKLGALQNLEGPTFSNLPFEFYRHLRIKVYSNVKRDFSRSRSCERDSYGLKLTCSPISVLSSCDGKTQRLSNARVRSLSAIERLFFSCFDLFQCILFITLRAQARARASVALGHSVPCGSPSARATAVPARWQRLTHSCCGARLRRQRRNGTVTLWRRRELRRGGPSTPVPVASRDSRRDCARLREALHFARPRCTAAARDCARHCCCGGAAN